MHRNRTPRGHYSSRYAQDNYEEKKERFGLHRKLSSDMITTIKKKITDEQWPPEQIVGRSAQDNIQMVCVETIYSYIRADKANGGFLYTYLRHRLRPRKKRGLKKITKGSSIKDRVSIHDRPPIIETKERMGDWEMDLIIGARDHQAILTLVERTTNFVLMQKLKHGKRAKEVAKVVVDLLLPYKSNVHSITTDNGTEFADHLTICKKLNTTVYFADPYSSWQKGLIENLNKLIRQYIEFHSTIARLSRAQNYVLALHSLNAIVEFHSTIASLGIAQNYVLALHSLNAIVPKKTSSNDYSDQDIKEIQQKLNRRPRKKLNFQIPLKLFFNTLT